MDENQIHKKDILHTERMSEIKQKLPEASSIEEFMKVEAPML